MKSRPDAFRRLLEDFIPAKFNGKLTITAWIIKLVDRRRVLYVLKSVPMFHIQSLSRALRQAVAVFVAFAAGDEAVADDATTS